MESTEPVTTLQLAFIKNFIVFSTGVIPLLAVYLVYRFLVKKQDSSSLELPPGTTYSQTLSPSSLFSTSPSPYLSVVIPAYNEEKRLPYTLKRTFDFFSTLASFDFEIIVVSDGIIMEMGCIIGLVKMLDMYDEK
ncbi:hypothetical protein RCL1_008109 [Eukaryota sp. TZLM3-RCL]